jgi:hydroxymethylpyrimidine/phosphomethylpyrimidine kinase
MDRGDPTEMNGRAPGTRTPIALTIAGSDSGGGAGIQADLKTFAALGVYGASAVTALTAQNTVGVHAIHAAPPAVVRAQIDAALEDFEVAAIKIGMLANAEIVEAVADALAPSSPSPLLEGERAAFIVYDPVLAASSGDPLADAGFGAAIRARLLALVDCLTPNLSEAATLLGADKAQSEAEMVGQGRALLAFGPSAVLMKGGHLAGAEAVDLLVTADTVYRYAAPRITSPNTHGTGCTLSSAIAAEIVLGLTLPDAVAAAKAFVRAAIERGAEARLGAGPGPLIQSPLVAPAAEVPQDPRQ